ncbi:MULTISPECIES: AraC family transcriptional regulator [unclassified Pseudomonas]|uniref:AraC family transcriptional regulator n=1 Tax=unclassified Pseudomonas TaxID=196821 RepID=UPI000C2FF10D|nr:MULTISPECIES: AraC family transcriptional regulator [unclassified Pseudomonas]MCU1739300.1 AraC family transcriptional regulator [Pseudomonas sp. 20S_6.2_Bac1]
MPTLAASCVQVILRLATDVLAPSIAFRKLCLDVEAKIQDGSRLDIVEVSKLVAAITEASGNPEVGLSAYGLFQPGQLNSQLYAIMSSATLEEALSTVERYSTLLGDGMPLSLTEEADSLSIHFLRIESLNLTRQYIDCCLSTTVGLTHWLLPWEKPMPIAAAFSYKRPADCTRLEAVFGKHLTFSQPVNKITYALSDCKRSLATANAALRLYHLNHTNEELSKRQYRIASAVKNHIFVGLSSGKTVSLESIARQLNLSVRTLQNRLEDESTGFRSLVDDCRCQLASQLLCFTSDTIMSIAEKLNFRDSSSFHKACNRWFGCPPGLYRSQKMELETH